MRSTLDMVRLGVDDSGEIAELVNRVWAASYGPTGAPVFTAAYLAWVYGGPDAADSALLGLRRDGALVAFKAMLSRPSLLDGQPLRAYQGTHLAIDRALPLAARVEAVARLGGPLGLLAATEHVPDAPYDAALVFYEDAKGIVKSTADVMGRHGLTRSFARVQQHVVNPVALRVPAGRARDAGTTVRVATREDLGDLVALHARAASSVRLAVTATADQLRHRLFGFDPAVPLVVEEHGRIAGLAQVLPLELQRGASRSTVGVVERLLLEGSLDAGALLLEEAGKMAASRGARGLVVENPTHVPAAALRPLGLVPSQRRMWLMIARRDPTPIPSEGGFLVDVK